MPRVTRSQKGQFWLMAKQISQSDSAPQQASGKLYVTVPLLQATGLHPGQAIAVSGTLYRPQPATNPGGFDFQAYLQQEGSFAGMRGSQVNIVKHTGWGWWQVRQRIVRSQMRWLGSPAGPLVSAMVLGGRGVDLPYSVKDQFVRVGLAHALAASGFQTSLILGVVLSLLNRCSAKVKFGVGCLALLVFVGLSGAQPAVLRAALMGFGGLVALLLDRTIKPLGALFAVATLMLVWNPLWIWDLGFQLSFLATLGLLVTVSPLTKWLDWLPSAIAPLVAVPVAAYLWTLPVQLQAFGVVSPYSIPVNLVTTPLISVLSLGGMASALASLLWSPAGSAIAWLLKYPTQLLLGIVETTSRLPGNAYATGTIAVWVAIALYGLLCLTWLQSWWRRHAWLALGFASLLICVPVWQAQTQLVRVTALASTSEPIMVFQMAGKVALLNTGDAKTAGFTVLPFLQKSGINQIDWVFAQPSSLAPNAGWQALTRQVPVKQLFLPSQPQTSPAFAAQIAVLAPKQLVHLNQLDLRWISTNPTAAEFQLDGQTWLWFGKLSPDQQRDWLKTTPAQTDVLCWSGGWLLPELVEALHPAVAIAFGRQVHPVAQQNLQKAGTQVFTTGIDGAIQWTPQAGFHAMMESSDNSAIAL